MRSWVPASVATAPVAIIGGWTLAAAQRPGFDPVTETISALAARDAPGRWLMTTALVVNGLAHLATAAGLTEARTGGRAVLALGGATTVGVALLPQPDVAHFPVATTAFVAMALWPALSGVPSRRVAIAASVMLGALDVWLMVELPREQQVGLVERFSAGAQALWPLAVVASLALGRRRGAAHRRRR